MLLELCDALFDNALHFIRGLLALPIFDRVIECRVELSLGHLVEFPSQLSTHTEHLSSQVADQALDFVGRASRMSYRLLDPREDLL